MKTGGFLTAPALLMETEYLKELIAALSRGWIKKS